MPIALHTVRETTGGAARRATVVLIHGVGSSHIAWDGVIAALPDGLDVIRYDLRGHGASEKPPGPYTLEDFVTDHLGLLRAEEVERCHLVGFSLGGMIAQAVAARHPEAVDRLVLLSSVAGRTDAERERVMERLAQVESHGPQGAAEMSGARWFTDAFVASHSEAVREHLERLAANEPDAYAAAYRVLATNDLAEEVSAITAPTLVMTGEWDIGSPPHMSQRLAERIPDARVRIVPGQKHSILRERPELIGEAIATFLTEEVRV